ncbi:MAG TPA: glycoside hydrolase family 2 [Lentisphaeria bacterium]|nr:MAG: hypothetical protein A2X48_01865 [Lentisphaerae bacterium GWF2_49_21]HBC88543.1 glycoside hydrolase family 2 [Lentisphaeria bacterium]
MHNIILNGEWNLSFKNPITGKQHKIDATVPGNIAVDLVREKIIPDPYIGMNSLVTYKWERTDFTYSTSFIAPELGKNEKLELLFEGIDTVATIKLDGKKISFVENMFIPHSIDITDAIKNGRKTHELSVEIHNIMDYSAARVKKWGMSAFEFCHMPVYEVIYARKAQHMFGWDIAPRILFGGIWRQASLRIRAAAEIIPEDFYFAVMDINAEKKSAKVEITWGLSLDPDTDWNDYSLIVKGACKNSKFERRAELRFSHGKMCFDIENAKLWWPAGYGDPDLYDITLVLQHKGKNVDTYKTRVGIRIVKLDINSDLKDVKNNRFAFYVNGVLIHVHGSNWVPVDALHSCDEKRIPRILEMWKETNCNIIRVWGGGVYEDHSFFNICDEYGLLVWQDFMFGCSRYPQNDEFLLQVKQEAEIIVRKLRNHASLALWAGDNEIDATFDWNSPGTVPPSQNKISRIVLKDVVGYHDPYRPYLPSSPFIPDDFFLAGSSATPEQHLWGPRGYFKADFYAKNTAKFASEIGYHGMPAKKSMMKFLSKDKVWGSYNNDEWIVHAAGLTGEADGPMGQRNYLMSNQVKHLFGTSVGIENIDDFILASQITQAEAKKYFVEMFRAGKPDRTGIIWWNMIDCWPQFSDAIVDYYYEKKLAYSYLSRVQIPCALMVSEERSGELEIVAVNDTLKKEQGIWSLMDVSSSNIISKGNYMMEPNGKEILGKVPKSKSMQFLLLKWKYKGLNRYNHYINGEAPWDFKAYRQAMGKFGK